MSKEIEYQLKYAHKVAKTGRAHIDSITTGMQARMSNPGVDEKVTKKYLIGHCDTLSAHAERYSAGLTAVSELTSSANMARGKRDEAESTLLATLSLGRGRLSEKFGQEILRLYRLDEMVPTSSEGKKQYAAEVAALLKKHPREWEDFMGNPISTVVLASKLVADLDAYKRACKLLGAVEETLDKARLDRDQMGNDFRVVLVNVAATLEAAFRIAGLDGLADRVRPARARSTNAPVDDEDVAEDGEEDEDEAVEEVVETAADAKAEAPVKTKAQE